MAHSRSCGLDPIRACPGSTAQLLAWCARCHLCSVSTDDVTRFELPDDLVQATTTVEQPRRRANAPVRWVHRGCRTVTWASGVRSKVATTSFAWRIFAVNATVFVVGAAILALSSATVSSAVSSTEAVVLVAGFGGVGGAGTGASAGGWW